MINKKTLMFLPLFLLGATVSSGGRIVLSDAVVNEMGVSMLNAGGTLIDSLLLVVPFIIGLAVVNFIFRFISDLLSLRQLSGYGITKDVINDLQRQRSITKKLRKQGIRYDPRIMNENGQVYRDSGKLFTRSVYFRGSRYTVADYNKQSDNYVRR